MRIYRKYSLSRYSKIKVKSILDAGFEVLKICPFMDLSGKVDENTWNMCVIGRCK